MTWVRPLGHQATEQKVFVMLRRMTIIPFIAISASQALADTNSDCMQSDAIDLKLTACTSLIDGRELTKHNLAVAYYNRGIAYGATKGGLDRAIADYGEAIALDPKFAPAYTNRGFAYAAKHEYEHILADLSDPGPKAGPADRNRGKAYWDNDVFDRVIADFTRAIDLDPKAAKAYNGRCVVRAMGNRDLQLALSDCEQAVRLLPGNSSAIENRGLVYLRLNRPEEAIADFSAALSIDAESARALYGRGLAKLKKDDQVGGDTDFAAAKAINADVAYEFARYGIN
jgi:tetratricopeptide (TPR) repeat protein